ncbi:MAG: glycosyl transferase [Beggiatoa sp. IS2]|nr:MAG: glycosyl transferase [Beggiatoa sp. IS2]
MKTALDISIVIVSFNTRDILRECLQTLIKEANTLNHEVIVIDNASIDKSAEMVATEFPTVQLIRSPINLGFAAANNLGFAQAKGRYIILLNSDAFLTAQALTKALTFMETHPNVGMGGARLIGKDGAWQPSARIFPSLLNHLLTISGLSTKYAKSRFFGRVDRTWANPAQAAAVDWVPGAFAIIRRSVLETVGYFDEQFFLYYEEVDLCKRIKTAGHEIWYLPEVVVVHLGGESSKTLEDMTISKSGTQIALWQLRSNLLFYRKHYGLLWTWLWMQLENVWHLLRIWKNTFQAHPEQELKIAYSKKIRQLLQQAWQDTRGGRVSPPRPW